MTNEQEEYKRMVTYIKNIVDIHQGTDIRINFVVVHGTIHMENVQRLKPSEVLEWRTYDDGDGELSINFDEKNLRYLG